MAASLVGSCLFGVGLGSGGEAATDVFAFSTLEDDGSGDISVTVTVSVSASLGVFIGGKLSGTADISSADGRRIGGNSTIREFGVLSGLDAGGFLTEGLNGCGRLSALMSTIRDSKLSLVGLNKGRGLAFSRWSGTL